MSAICDGCSWTGPATKVIDGGRCPTCRTEVRYDRAPIDAAPSAVRDVAEFNQRATKALNGVTFPAGSNTRVVVSTFRMQLAADDVSPKMQQAIYNIVHRYRRQITDQLLLDYAVMHAKGAD